MQTAKALLEIYRSRGERGLPLERVYRHLFNPEWYLRAYGKLYRNDGALTAGVTEETVDDMALDKIHRMIDLLRYERYRWKPVRRTYIPKPQGGTRPLGLPTWGDKLLQEVLRTLLEAYYEPQFRDSSHGFRPGRSCHTALSEIRKTWTGTIWFIEGDIAKCFDRIDHTTLLDILREKLHDERVLRLMEDLLGAGYLEDWKWNSTMSGTPQGGIASPLLSNVYLHELDKFIEDELIPKYTRGRKQDRLLNPEYARVQTQLTTAKRRKDWGLVKKLIQLRRQLPSYDTYDPAFRRLRYIRYADDFLLGFIGPKQEAEAIKVKVGSFLQQRLRLELSETKTRITHAKSEKARFLGYEIQAAMENTKVTRGSRSVNGRIQLMMPSDVIHKIKRRFSSKGKVTFRRDLLASTDYTIVSRYQSVLRGVYNYYQLAVNVAYGMNHIRWILERSLTKTLCSRFNSREAKILKKYRIAARGEKPYYEATVERDGKEPLVARFGGLSFKRNRGMVEPPDNSLDRLWYRFETERSELIQRLLKGKCELCGSTEDICVHHIRKLADIERPKAKWERVMIARKRKTLVICRMCHRLIHKGEYDGPRLR